MQQTCSDRTQPVEIDSPNRQSAVDRRSLLRLGVAGAALAGLPVGSARLEGQGRQGAAPAEVPFPEPSYLRTNNGLRMAVYESGPEDGIPLVFCHGFPELAYSWRHQLAALGEAGYRCLAPDQRGYGNTQRPLGIEEYNLVELCRDLVGLLDDRAIDRAFFVGHDWGGGVVWMMPRLHGDRVRGVIGLNTPSGPPSPVQPIPALRAARGESNYVVSFQEPYRAEEVLEAEVAKTFAMFLRKGMVDPAAIAQLPEDSPMRNFDLLSMLRSLPSVDAVNAMPGESILTPAEMRYFVETFERTGFTGGVNWYRNIDRNWELTRKLDHQIGADKPCLYIGAANDAVLPPSSADGMENFIADLEKKTIADCGHWTQQEQPAQTNAILIDWLGRKA